MRVCGVLKQPCKLPLGECLQDLNLKVGRMIERLAPTRASTLVLGCVDADDPAAPFFASAAEVLDNLETITGAAGLVKHLSMVTEKLGVEKFAEGGGDATNSQFFGKTQALVIWVRKVKFELKSVS